MNTKTPTTFANFDKLANENDFPYTDSNHDSYDEFWIAGNPDKEFAVFYRSPNAEAPDAGLATIVHAEDGQPYQHRTTDIELDDAFRIANELNNPNG